MLKHIAIIPDGNRRWAKKYYKSIKEAYIIGINKVRDVLKWCIEKKIKVLTFWGFSTENNSRDEKEKSILFSLFDMHLSKVLTEMLKREKENKEKIQFNLFGDFSFFPNSIQEKIKKINLNFGGFDKDKYTLNILLGYGGRKEIINAINKILQEHRTSINEDDFKNYLYTKQLPDPDLIIRTSGEKRLSGLMPWQSVYAELYFSKKFWPEFDKKEFELAINDYYGRKRRFGK